MRGRRTSGLFLALLTLIAISTFACKNTQVDPEKYKIVTLTTYHGSVEQAVNPETATASISIKSNRRRERWHKTNKNDRKPWGEPNTVPCRGVEFSVRYYELDEATGMYDKSKEVHRETVAVGEDGILIVPFPAPVRKLGTTNKGCRVEFVSVEAKPMPIQDGNRWFTLKIRNEDLQAMWQNLGGR